MSLYNKTMHPHEVYSKVAVIQLGGRAQCEIDSTCYLHPRLYTLHANR